MSRRVLGVALAVLMALVPPARAATPYALQPGPAARTDASASEPSRAASRAPSPANGATGAGNDSGFPAAGRQLTTVPGGELHADDSSKIEDDVSDVRAGEFGPSAWSAVVMVHHTGMSETSSRTSAARAPPARAGRLLPGVPRPHDPGRTRLE